MMGSWTNGTSLPSGRNKNRLNTPVPAVSGATSTWCGGCAGRRRKACRRGPMPATARCTRSCAIISSGWTTTSRARRARNASRFPRISRWSSSTNRERRLLGTTIPTTTTAEIAHNGFSMKSGVWRGALIRLVAVALAIGTVSDGRTSRIAHAQGVSDPIVVKARAAINRGEYAEAEALLKPLAAKAPEGEAALELGLFYELLGRADESRSLLRRIADMQVGPRTSPVEYARMGRAARSLGEFQLANDAYRLATEKAPTDPALHTGWGELFLHVHNNPEAAKSFQDALAADAKWIP